MISLAEAVLKRLPAYRSKADAIPEGDDLRPRLGDFIQLHPADEGEYDCVDYGVIVVDENRIPRILPIPWFECDGDAPDLGRLRDAVYKTLTPVVDGEAMVFALPDPFETAGPYKDLCHLTNRDTLLARWSLPDSTPLILGGREAIAEAYLKDYRYEDSDIPADEDSELRAKVGDLVCFTRRVLDDPGNIVEWDGIIAVDSVTGIPFLLMEGDEPADWPAVLEAMEHEGSISRFLKHGYDVWDIGSLADWYGDPPFLSCRHDAPGMLKTCFGFAKDYLEEKPVNVWHVPMEASYTIPEWAKDYRDYPVGDNPVTDGTAVCHGDTVAKYADGMVLVLRDGLYEKTYGKGEQ